MATREQAYIIISGTWADGSTETIYEQVEVGTIPQNIPTGMIPNPGFYGGYWSPDPYQPMPSTRRSSTYYFRRAYKITYVVRHGTWANGTTEPIVSQVEQGGVPTDIPTGMIPDRGRAGGVWDPNPYNPVTQDDRTFYYSFNTILPTHTVTYHVANGTWADGTDGVITEQLYDGESPMGIPTGMIPSEGFSENGSWEPDPNGYVVNDDVHFVFTFEAIPIRDWAVLLRIVNGTWSDGSTTAKQYTVTDGETLPEIPTGMMPFEGFGNGYWSADPSVPIREDRTFIYTFRRIAPSDEVHFFTLGGVESIELGMYIGGQHTYNAPKRDVTKISVPGRNGDLIQDNGRFLNVQVPYNVVVMEEFRKRTDELKSWLLSTSKYRKLVDTYHPGTYRLARVGEDIVFQTSAFNLTGKTQIIFDCKPQRFLDEGDEVVNISAGSNTIVNPTLFDSEPILKVYVSGGDVNATLRINNAEMELRNIDEYVVIDSEVKECYKDGQSRNSHIVLANYKFPTLKPGINSFEFSSGITRIEVTPKWWTI